MSYYISILYNTHQIFLEFAPSLSCFWEEGRRYLILEYPVGKVVINMTVNSQLWRWQGSCSRPVTWISFPGPEHTPWNVRPPKNANSNTYSFWSTLLSLYSNSAVPTIQLPKSNVTTILLKQILKISIYWIVYSGDGTVIAVLTTAIHSNRS